MASVLKGPRLPQLENYRLRMLLAASGTRSRQVRNATR